MRLTIAGCWWSCASKATPAGPPALSSRQRDEAVRKVLGVLPRKRAHGLQIDFNARRSQREFYRALLGKLRGAIPGSWPLSMTALASWCLHDDWLGGLPIDEAVPMLFHMGLDGPRVRLYLESGEDFHSPLARNSYGLFSREEPPPLRAGRRLYLFHPQPWQESSFRAFLREVRP